MAENESLDLGASYSQRWVLPFRAVRRGAPCGEGHRCAVRWPQADVIELLARYRDEWMTIASQRGRNGHRWARLLAMHERNMEGVTHAPA